MATDARFSTNLVSHPKTKKLLRRLGPAGGWAWVCLVLWTAANRSDGDLSGMSDEDIELSADWAGEEGALVRELVSIRLMDGDEGSRSLHDWAEHNPWAAGSDARSMKARWNAAKRHHGEAEADKLVPEYAAIRAGSNASSNGAADAQHDNSNAPSPSPSPSPSPTQGPSPAAPTPAPKPGKRRPIKTAMPEGFGISERVKAWAAEKGHNRLQQHLESFRSKCIAKAYAYADWDEAFMNAIRDDWAKLRNQPQGFVSGAAPPVTVPSDAAARTAAEMAARMAHLDSPEAKAAAEAARRKFLESRKATA